MTTNGKELLTYSRQQCFKQCRRREMYAYEYGVRRVVDGKALRMGSAYHSGLENLETSGLDAACEAIHDAYATSPAQDEEWEREWRYEEETVIRLLCGYAWRWENSGIEHVAKEQAFQLPLINPATKAESKLFLLAGKIDGIVKLEDGRLAVLECKTMSDSLAPDSDLWRRLRIDSQISLYVSAARRLGYDVSCVLYDCTRKPAIAPTPVARLCELGAKIVLDRYGQRVKTAKGQWRQTGSTADGYTLQTRPMSVEEWGTKLTDDIAERPDWYYCRQEVARLDNDLEEFSAELWEVQQTLRESQRTGRWYRTVSRECVYCPYFEPCTTGYDPSTGLVPDGFVFVDDRNPELGGLWDEQTGITAT